jgi:hypothetical protein
MFPHWLEQSSTIQRVYLNESFRLGPTNVELVKAMFLGRHEDMVSARKKHGDSNDSLVLMTSFSRLDDWQHDSRTKEILWSPIFCSHVALLVALEVVSITCGDDKDCDRGVCLVSFWKGFLGQIEKFLNKHLLTLCVLVHRRLELPIHNNPNTEYSATELRANGKLMTSAVVGVGGSDCCVEILCLPHRQEGDWGWIGSPNERHLQLIATTRASRRLHVLIEDLSSEIILPSAGLVAQEGVDFGLKRRKQHHFSESYTEAQITNWQNFIKRTQGICPEA